MRRILSVWGGERRRRTFIPRIQQLTQTFLSWMDRLINVWPNVVLNAGTNLYRKWGNCHTSVRIYSPWTGGNWIFRRNKQNIIWVFVVRESACLSLSCHCLQKVVVAFEKLPFPPLSQKHWVNNRKLHKQVLRLSVCLLGPYLAFKSVERSHPGGWGEEIRAAVVRL